VTLDLSGFALMGAGGSAVIVSAGLPVNIGLSALRATIEACVARNNDGSGFEGSQCTFERCVSVANGLFGFSVGGSTAVSCVARENQFTGFVGVRANLTGCTAELNGVAGFNVADNSRISRCLSVGHEGDGILVGTQSSIIGNTCNENTGAGIRVDDDNDVRENTCSENVAGGILVTARENLIEDNRVSTAPSASRYRTTARDNSGANYVIVSGNRVGVISLPPLSGDINGDVDPDALGAGTTDPWANFSY